MKIIGGTFAKHYYYQSDSIIDIADSWPSVSCLHYLFSAFVQVDDLQAQDSGSGDFASYRNVHLVNCNFERYFWRLCTISGQWTREGKPFGSSRYGSLTSK